MPTVLVDPATFTSAISMGAIPREIFGKPGQQEVNKDGIPRWTIGVAVSYAPDIYGITSPSEVLNIGVAAAEDPSMSIPPGTPVKFDSLRVGASAPEQRERKDGSGMRVVGGKMFWSAASVLPAQQAWNKKSDAA